MTRRIVFICFFLLFGAGVIWYATAFVQVPEMNFAEASKVGDAKKKVMVPGRVRSDRPVTAEGNQLRFEMIDRTGASMPVYYSGEDPVSVDRVKEVAAKSENVSVAGHVDPDYFHASSISLPSK
jgi:hypothetical protein